MVFFNELFWPPRRLGYVQKWFAKRFGVALKMSDVWMALAPKLQTISKNEGQTSDAKIDELLIFSHFRCYHRLCRRGGDDEGQVH